MGRLFMPYLPSPSLALILTVQCYDGAGRASSPVGRAAFKAVELLLKWLVGSTPTSSANHLPPILFTRYLPPID